MLALQPKHPEIYREFQSGNFTVQKIANAFSAILLDQAHEQNNELIKGEGGAIGLTENPSALLRWMVSGPELARLVREFEKSDEDQHTELPHHKQSHASQTRFKNRVSTLVSTIGEVVNPFEETSEDLVSLMSKDIADTSVGTTLRKIGTLRKEQYTVFVRKRLIDQSKPLEYSNPRNNLCLWTSSAKTQLDRDKLKLVNCLPNSTLVVRIAKVTSMGFSRMRIKDLHRLYLMEE